MAIGLIILGVLLAGWPQLRLDTADPIGLGSAILTPLIFGIYIAIAYRFTRETSPSAGATFIYLGLACGFAIATLMFGLKVPAHWDGWWRLIVIALLGGVLQISAFAYALPRHGLLDRR